MIYILDTVGSNKSIMASLWLIYDVYENNLINNDNRVICLFGNSVLNNTVKK